MNRKVYYTPMTNADRIRTMTDEELAKWIATYVLNLWYASAEMATEAWLNWLRQRYIKKF